ncbi:MAG: vitamin K epoxide reductase family protein [Chloroflexi bacterium]|nr:vitamin K epoxide reductase family protein [Chloroflexota bacterium]MBP8055280.1 vitamin K epoxide reductase family protein [Chloroflexota bacterium]
MKLRSDWPVKLIQLLAIPGLMVAYYLWLFHDGSLIAGCTGSGWDDCGRVSGPDAPYSAIGPIPVALIGLMGYIGIFLLIWLKESVPWLEDNLPELLVGMTGLGFLFSLGLTGLELLVIHAFCRYCVISAVIMTIMFALALFYLRRRE